MYYNYNFNSLITLFGKNIFFVYFTCTCMNMFAFGQNGKNGKNGEKCDIEN